MSPGLSPAFFLSPPSQAGRLSGDMSFGYVSPAREDLFRKARLEVGLADLGTDLVTGGADARAEGGRHVGRLRAVSLPHGPDGLFEDPLLGAAPAAVDGGHGPTLGVDEKDGQAVGRADDEKQAGDVRHQGVALELGRGRAVQADDGVAVDLAHDDRGHALGGGEGREPGLAPAPVAKAVDEPGDGEPAGHGEEGTAALGHGNSFSRKPALTQGGAPRMPIGDTSPGHVPMRALQRPGGGLSFGARLRMMRAL